MNSRNKKSTFLQNASAATNLGERTAVTGASQSVRRNDNNTTPQELTKEIVEVL
jgi:hypothetical protein